MSAVDSRSTPLPGAFLECIDEPPTHRSAFSRPGVLASATVTHIKRGGVSVSGHLSSTERGGVSASGSLSHAQRGGVSASTTLTQNRGGVTASGSLSSDRGGVGCSGTLARTVDAAQVRLCEKQSTPKVTLKENNPVATFFQWIKDEDGHVYLVTMDDESGNPVGWDKNDITLAETIDKCAQDLLKGAKTSKGKGDATRYQGAESLTFVSQTDGTHFVEADMPRKDDRSFFTKGGTSAYEAVLGKLFGPIRVGIKYGGTFRLTGEAAKASTRPLESIKHALDLTTRFTTNAITDKRRQLDVILKRHREQLLQGNSPVETTTKTEAIEALIEHHEADNDIAFHPPVEVRNGKVRNLDVSLFSDGKDVVVPVTVVNSDGSKHAVSIYYDSGRKKDMMDAVRSPCIYFYDSLGKPIKEGGAEAVVNSIQNIRSLKGWNMINPARLFFRQSSVKDAKTVGHQPKDNKDCARYSILFFETLIRARMNKAETVDQAFITFTDSPLNPSSVHASMERLAPDLEKTCYNGKRWHPDDMETDADGKPVSSPRIVRRGLSDEL